MRRIAREVRKEGMRTGITVAGIVVLIIGLFGLGVSAAYASFGGGIAGSVATAIGVITTGIGAALKRSTT